MLIATATPAPSKAALDAVHAALEPHGVRRDVALAKYTTFGIGGPADLFVDVKTEAALRDVLTACTTHGVPAWTLGGGSNLLVADGGVAGVVFRLRGELAKIDVSDDGKCITVGAGATFPKLSKTAIRLGWPSAVGWTGTPGQVGGALKMNAGTRDGEIGDVVTEVSAVSAQSDLTFDARACGFSYRMSNFPPNVVLTKAILRCETPLSQEAKALEKRAKALLSRRHSSQPKQRSAGSIFKNPDGDFAGRLIQEAGLKGLAIGAAQISDVHANFIVNHGGATAADVLALADRAVRDVKQQFGVELRWEVKRVGRF